MRLLVKSLRYNLYLKANTFLWRNNINKFQNMNSNNKLKVGMIG